MTEKFRLEARVRYLCHHFPPPSVIMSSFVIFWLTPPSPSGDDVIYEQPLINLSVQARPRTNIKAARLTLQPFHSKLGHGMIGHIKPSHLPPA